MYIQTEDYETIWSLSHKWVGHDPETTDPNNLPSEVALYIQRVSAAIFRNQLPARNKKRVIFIDDSFISFLIDFKHLKNLRACVFDGRFDKSYLTTIYVRRPHVIEFCAKEFLEVPSFWQTKNQNIISNASYDSSDDENITWYTELTERRKQRVACLELAKKLWDMNPSRSYEQIFNDEIMRQFGNPKVFSLEAFKKWARPFAPDQIKEGGRPSKIK